MIQAIKINDGDNVAIAVGSTGMKAGEKLEKEGITLIENVPQCHKISLRYIAKGETIIRYGVAIGTAKEPIEAGRWVQEKTVEMPPLTGFERSGMETAAAGSLQTTGRLHLHGLP